MSFGMDNIAKNIKNFDKVRTKRNGGAGGRRTQVRKENKILSDREKGANKLLRSFIKWGVEKAMEEEIWTSSRIEDLGAGPKIKGCKAYFL